MVHQSRFQNIIPPSFFMTFYVASIYVFFLGAAICKVSSTDNTSFENRIEHWHYSAHCISLVIIILCLHFIVWIFPTPTLSLCRWILLEFSHTCLLALHFLHLSNRYFSFVLDAIGEYWLFASGTLRGQ